MCTLIRCTGTCAPKGGTTLAGTLTGTALAALVRAVAKGLELLIVALVAVTVWTAPRAWRLGVRVTRAGWRRWQETRPVTGQLEAPAARPALTDLPTGHVRWSDLLDKKEANA